MVKIAIASGNEAPVVAQVSRRLGAIGYCFGGTTELE